MKNKDIMVEFEYKHGVLLNDEALDLLDYLQLTYNCELSISADDNKVVTTYSIDEELSLDEIEEIELYIKLRYGWYNEITDYEVQ